MKTLLACLLAALAGGIAVVESGFSRITAASQFEVASVRLTPPTGEHGINLSLRLEPSLVHIAAFPLRDVVALAYRVEPRHVIGPEWMQSTQVNISARLPDGTTVQQAPEMLQALLADRFGLVVRREKREADVYALVVGKPPLRLERKSEPVASPGDALTWALSGGPWGVSNDRGNGSSYSFISGKFEGKKLTVAAFAAEFSRYSPKSIVDMTQLSGVFDISFSVSSEEYMQLLVRAAYNSGMAIPSQMLLQMDTDGSGALDHAVEQMGLKLESQRLPMDVVVIDAVQREPTEN